MQDASQPPATSVAAIDVISITDEEYDELVEIWKLSWAEFKQELNHKFLDTTCKQKARQQFEVIHQHQNKMVADFFICLELILGIAGYYKEDNYVVDKLK